MQTKTVRVTRAFYVNGKATKIGDVLDLPHVFALEMLAAHKVVPAEKPKPEQKPEQPAEKQVNGGKHAR